MDDAPMSGTAFDVNVAWLSEHCTSRHYDAWDRAVAHFMSNPAFVAWLGEHQDFPSRGHYFEVNDNDKTRQVRVTLAGWTVVSYKTSITRLNRADDLTAELEVILSDLYLTWAQRAGFPSPPAL